MNHQDLERLETRALRTRERIVRMAAGGGCFLGASLSCADLIVYLYSVALNITPDTASNRDRDYFFLSKGHDVPALYAVLADLGFFDPARLANHLQTTDHIYWHPNRFIPGVEFHSGSLGHLLAVALGVALDIRMCGGASRVFVLVGDGELNEGSIWEAALVCAAKKLDNLVLIVDRNRFQANVATEDLTPLEPIASKFEAFGWAAARLDGHDFADMERRLARLPLQPGRPTAIVADTVRGKGIASIEGRADRWFVALSDADAESFIAELRGGAAAALHSEALIVR